MPAVRNAFSRIPGVVTENQSQPDQIGRLRESSGMVTLPFTGDANQNWSVSMGTSSKRFRIFRSRYWIRGSTDTIRIENIKASRHDEAVQLLEDVSGSVFFEMDLCYGLAFGLAKISPLSSGRRLNADGSSSYRPRMPRERSTDPPQATT
jgi:hypothetical protein